MMRERGEFSSGTSRRLCLAVVRPHRGQEGRQRRDLVARLQHHQLREVVP